MTYGQAAKLSVPLLADGPARVVTSFTGSTAGLDRLNLDAGPETGLRAVTALRPDLALNPTDALLTTGHDDPWAPGVYSIRGLAAPVDEAALRASITCAGEHTAGPLASQMEGALASGERAAEVLAPRVPADVP